jgi:hypothetical protein
VYEKGAEVIGLYRTLLGEEGFKRGMKLYFERHDGHAVTCDDFRAAMAGTVRVEARCVGCAVVSLSRWGTCLMVDQARWWQSIVWRYNI